jgi:hypothetical protein
MRELPLGLLTHAGHPDVANALPAGHDPFTPTRQHRTEDHQINYVQ